MIPSFFMENDSKFLVGAYQKKSFELFNQVIATEARVQQQQELIEAQNAKLIEFSEANKALVAEVQKLEVHINETNSQLQNATAPKKTTRKKPIVETKPTNVRDGGTF